MQWRKGLGRKVKQFYLSRNKIKIKHEILDGQTIGI